MSRSAALFRQARELIPGGVSSPARAFGAVGGEPLVAMRGEGALLYDADGRAYVDYVQGFGAVILGHAHPAVVEAVSAAAARGGAVGLSTPDEVRLASAVVRLVPSVERVRFVASGTEAAMTAARLARAATGRELIVTFEGCYHGHADAFLARAGSGVAAMGAERAAGVPEGAVAHTLVLPYNDTESWLRACDRYGRQMAAVFVEPVAANMGVVLPDAQWLVAVTTAAREAGALVVFDEVVTGFRVGLGGAQGAFGLEPDLTMLGKVIGGGLPVGAVGGRAELMELLAPSGPVFQAGTFAAHPHAMAAGAATLEALDEEAYARLEATAATLAAGLEEAARQAGVEVAVVRARTFLSVHFRPSPPRDLTDVRQCDGAAFAAFHRALRNEGVLVPPSPYEAWFPSLAHGPEELGRTLQAARAAFAAIGR